MNSEFRKDRRDAYFLSSRGLRKMPVERKGLGVWIPLALIVVALVMVRVLVDFM